MGPTWNKSFRSCCWFVAAPGTQHEQRLPVGKNANSTVVLASQYVSVWFPHCQLRWMMTMTSRLYIIARQLLSRPRRAAPLSSPPRVLGAGLQRPTWNLTSAPTPSNHRSCGMKAPQQEVVCIQEVLRLRRQRLQLASPRRRRVLPSRPQNWAPRPPHAVPQ